MTATPGDPSQTTATAPVTTDEAVRIFSEYLSTVRAHREGNHRHPLWVWKSHEALLTSMVGEPTVVDTLTLPDTVRPGEVKECFYNAFMLSATRSTYTYTEGFAYAGFFPVPHAWVTDEETGDIIDPTWVNLDYEGPFIYLGMRFSHRFMLDVIDDGAQAPAVFEGDWQRQFRALRCGFLLDADGVVTDWGDPPPF